MVVSSLITIGFAYLATEVLGSPRYSTLPYLGLVWLGYVVVPWGANPLIASYITRRHPARVGGEAMERQDSFRNYMFGSLPPFLVASVLTLFLLLYVVGLVLHGSGIQL